MLHQCRRGISVAVLLVLLSGCGAEPHTAAPSLEVSPTTAALGEEEMVCEETYGSLADCLATVETMLENIDGLYAGVPPELPGDGGPCCTAQQAAADSASATLTAKRLARESACPRPMPSLATAQDSAAHLSNCKTHGREEIEAFGAWINTQGPLIACITANLNNPECSTLAQGIPAWLTPAPAFAPDLQSAAIAPAMLVSLVAPRCETSTWRGA